MYRFIKNFYLTLFGGKFFFKFNKLLYLLSLHGLGVLNYEDNKKSGENYFIWHELKKIDGGVVLDIGANVGEYCCEIKKVNNSLDVYAFEPHPITYKRLLENTKCHDINIFNLGVGANEDTLILYDYVDQNGSEHASTYRGVIEQIHKGSVVETNIRVISLDNFVTQYSIDKIALVKIDTEGHELEVLRGARRLLNSGKIDMIQLEFNEMNVISRVFFKDIWDFLPNYDFYRMLPDGLIQIKSYQPLFCEIFGYQNILLKLRK